MSKQSTRPLSSLGETCKQLRYRRRRLGGLQNSAGPLSNCLDSIRCRLSHVGFVPRPRPQVRVPFIKRAPIVSSPGGILSHGYLQNSPSAGAWQSSAVGIHLQKPTKHAPPPRRTFIS